MAICECGREYKGSKHSDGCPECRGTYRLVKELIKIERERKYRGMKREKEERGNGDENTEGVQMAV